MVGRDLEPAEREVVVPGRERVLVEQELLGATRRAGRRQWIGYCWPSTVREK